MIIARYLVKEVFVTLLGVALILMLIALSAQLVGLFGKVASGMLQIDTVLLVFALKAIVILVFILPLSLYLAILLAFSRLYKDSEMTALAACGTGPGYVVRSVLGIALVFAVLQAWLTLQIAPWAEDKTQRIMVQAQSSSDIQGITAGRFKEMSQGIGVIYVQEVDDEKKRMRNIFLQQLHDRGQSVVTSRSGYQYVEQKNGDRFMVLEQGHRYEGEPGRENYTVIEFAKHGIRIQEKEPEVISRKNKAIPSRDLLGSDNSGYVSELQWRISSALMCLVLAVLAVPLSQTSPRQGRYAKLALAIVLYLVFTNLLSLSRSWLLQQKIPPELGLWWVHGVMLILAIALVLRQTGVRHLFIRKPGPA